MMVKMRQIKLSTKYTSLLLLLLGAILIEFSDHTGILLSITCYIFAGPFLHVTELALHSFLAVWRGPHKVLQGVVNTLVFHLIVLTICFSGLTSLSCFHLLLSALKCF